MGRRVSSRGMRAVIAGDVHGNVDHVRFLMEVCRDVDASFLVVVGDFGFWPHYDWGVDFLEFVEAEAQYSDVFVLWIDGNHDNHDVLDQKRESLLDDDLTVISPHVFHVPRGCRFELGGLQCVGFGGALSVDASHRREGDTWWSQELVSRGQIDRLRERVEHPDWDGRAIDVLFTHEAPLASGMRAPAHHGVDELSYKDVISESLAQRRLISEVTDLLRPSVQFCGHHHVRRTFERTFGDGSTCEVQVLGRDSMGADSYVVLDCGDAPYDWAADFDFAFEEVDDVVGEDDWDV